MFEVKDSGERREYASGMVRDTDEKVRWDLVFDGPMLRRYAEHLTKGALKYAPRNWMKARTEEELDRARQSAARHFAQWMAGETDEDHAAAVIFNLNLAEYVKARLPIMGTDSTEGVGESWAWVCSVHSAPPTTGGWYDCHGMTEEEK